MILSFHRRKSAVTQMTFIDHLEALRGHIIRSLLAIIAVGSVLFVYRNWVFDNVIAGPLNPNFITYRVLCRFSSWAHIGDALCMPPVHVNLQSATFGGQFISSITLSFIGGVIVAFPYIFWEFWRFVKPALKASERKNTRFIIFWVSFFFFGGALFGFFLLGPFTFNFLAGFQLGSMNTIITRPTIADYFDNLTNLILGCGLAFELPVLSFILTKVGILTPGFLKEKRRYALVIILIMAAVITPSPDWMSQLIVFIPLWLLYELSVRIASRVAGQRGVED